MPKNKQSNRIARHAGKQGARNANVWYAFDKSATRQKLLSCKDKTVISTFNSRTMSSESQLNEVINAAIETKQDIICIQEHRLYHPDVIMKQHFLGENWLLITASSWKNTRNASIGGIGILLSPRAQKALDNVEMISPRIIIASFNGNPKCTVISCYSPTNCSPEDEVSNFYDELSSLTRQVPKHNILIVGGDFNAKLGQETGYLHSFHKCSNRNGLLLHEYIVESRLICLNAKYQKRQGKKWTFSYPNQTRAQLDFILVNRKWSNGVTDCQSYNTFDCVGSDHRIVSAKIKLSLRANKVKTTKKPRFDWSTLRTDSDIRETFHIALSNRYNALQSLNTEEDINTAYVNFEKACGEAANECIPLKSTVRKRKPWQNENVERKRDALKEAARERNQNPGEENDRLVKKAKKELRETYEKEQSLYLQTQIDTISNAADNKQAALAWKTINDITGRRKTNCSKIKATNQDERIKKWKTQFEELLGKSPVIRKSQTKKVTHSELNIKKGPFSMLELDEVLDKISNNKACGLDEIPAEVWKTRNFNQQLLSFCNNVYQQKPIERWREGCILPFPKKGDLSSTENYRGITLTCIAAKIYNLLLLNRIRPEVDKLLRKNQNGFRKNRSTTGQILTIRRILEGVRQKKLSATLLFIDFKKAFDSVHREKLAEILLSYGVPEEIVSAIMMLYINTRSMVRSPDGDTDFFDVTAGVLQGDTLAPYLFIICLDYVLRISVDKDLALGFTLRLRRSARHPAVCLTDIDYADDLALLADTNSDAEKLLHILENAASEIGLYINCKKTKYIAQNQEQETQIKSANDKNIESVDDFLYLGSYIESTAHDIDVRKAKAWSALNKLSCIWKSNLPDYLKRRFFRSVVESVLLYGSVSWTLTKKLETSLDGTYTRMLRAALNLDWRDHPSINDIYGSLPRVSVSLRERRLRFAGHSYRSKDELVSDVLLWRPSHGTDRRGRPTKTYIDQIADDAGCLPEDLPNLMSDREQWKARVKRVRDINSTR